MKRKQSLFLLLLLFVTISASYAQKPRLPPFFDLYFNDSIRVESTVYSAVIPPKIMFHNDKNMDKTLDGIYFVLYKSWYMIFVPEKHLMFKCTNRVYNSDSSISNHFVMLISEIRKNKSELTYSY